MKRVVVIGSGGSGKSTFSRRLGEITGLPVIHLDRLYWRPNWVKTAKDEWRQIVAELIERDEWIMDGNFGGTREMRLRTCDTVILLDIPRRVCLYRIVKRRLKYRGKGRPDMAEGCTEKLDLEFFLWVWRYPSRARPRILEELIKFGDKDILILKSNAEIDSYLARQE